MHLLFLLYFVFSTLWSVQNAALQTCSSAEADLPNGIWTEWETTEPCSTECGSCSKRFYTRKCISASVGKNCSGNSTRQIICNTQVCAYPAQRACCVPYVPMLIDGKTQCGPFPKDSSSTGTSCCPSGGLLSSWSAFFLHNDTKLFTRTRKCISEQMDCPCTGSALIDTRASCPCQDFEDVSKEVALSHRTYPNSKDDFVVDNNETCYGYHPLVTQASSGTSRPCNSYTTYKDFSASLIRYIKLNADGSKNDTPQEFRVFDCAANDVKKNKITFYCDLSSKHWRLDGTNNEVIGWNQINILNA